MKQDPGSVFHNVRVTVLGAGESGMAAARWLEPLGAEITVSDSRPEAQWDRKFSEWCSSRGITVDAGRHSEQACTGCSIMVASPGIPSSAPPVVMAAEAGAVVVNDLVLAACFWKGKIIAVTGTNGKTTTTMLIAHLLEKSGIKAVTAGNISPPLFEVMDRGASDVTAVLEVSSFQLEMLNEQWNLPFPVPEISIAVWLNLAPDHLDRHGDLKTYGECKARLLDMQGPEHWAVLNSSDSGLEPWFQRGRAKRAFFAGSHQQGTAGAYFDENKNTLALYLPSQDKSGIREEKYDLSNWQPAGRHNLENLAAAALSARLAGAKADGIKKGIETFRPPAHRFETVAVSDGITYIDDSKATNVAAAIRALESVSGPVVLIAGGLGKDEDYMPLARKVAGLADCGMMRGVVLLGRHGPRIAAAIFGVSLPKTVSVELLTAFSDGRDAMEQAVRQAVNLAMPGDAVLLSPACASFDMFSDYGHRGAVFTQAVKEIACASPDTQSPYLQTAKKGLGGKAGHERCMQKPGALSGQEATSGTVNDNRQEMTQRAHTQ